MNRREFFRRASVALVGAAVATKVPTVWLPAPVQRHAAIEYLRRAYNGYLARSGSPPRSIRAAPDLYDAYESELTACMRFGSPADLEGPQSLMFKGTRVYRETALAPWVCVLNA